LREIASQDKNMHMHMHMHTTNLLVAISILKAENTHPLCQPHYRKSVFSHISWDASVVARSVSKSIANATTMGPNAEATVDVSTVATNQKSPLDQALVPREALLLP
jgi:hypothetical protein